MEHVVCRTKNNRACIVWFLDDDGDDDDEYMVGRLSLRQSVHGRLLRRMLRKHKAPRRLDTVEPE